MMVALDELTAVEAAVENVDDAIGKRDAAIIAAVVAGYSYRQVAAAARMTHPTVAGIIRQYTADHDDEPF